MTGREFELNDKDFSFIRTLVYDKTGIVLAEHKRNMVYSRLTRRLRELKLDTFRHYCDLLSSKQGDDELGNLVNAITTNLTSFFRESHHFDHLLDEALPDCMKRNAGKKRLRLWSAGCSSGAEPYSIAMPLAKTLEQHRGWDAKILATDIDTNMLDTGSSGLYDKKNLSRIPSPYQRYVHDSKSSPDMIEMKPSLKDLISFRRLNLLEPWPIKGPFDILFCRNVVIYFDKETQQKLFARYAELMPEGGWLYIGHSENLFSVTDQFELVGNTVYRRKG